MCACAPKPDGLVEIVPAECLPLSRMSVHQKLPSRRVDSFNAVPIFF
jgi:hypothetical protein